MKSFAVILPSGASGNGVSIEQEEGFLQVCCPNCDLGLLTDTKIANKYSCNICLKFWSMSMPLPFTGTFPPSRLKVADYPLDTIRWWINRWADMDKRYGEEGWNPVITLPVPK